MSTTQLLGLSRCRTTLRRAILTLLAAVVVLGSGYVVAGCSSAAQKRADAHPVTPAMLINLTSEPPAVETFWQQVKTGHHGVGTLCRGAGYADPAALSTWVRQVSGEHKNRPRRLVQTVQTSASAHATGRAYDTLVASYSRCAGRPVQLVRSWRLDGVGETGEMFWLRSPGTDHLVAISRTGLITSSAVLDGSRDTRSMLAGFAASAKRLCTAGAAGPCPRTTPKATPSPPPPSGQTPGALATIDLPQVSVLVRPQVGPKPRFRALAKPWDGSTAAMGGTNLAATPCDATNFTKLPVRAKARSRTFLIPRAGLPHRFGLTETWAPMKSASAARTVVARVRHEMATCHKRQLGSQIHDQAGGPAYSLWRTTVQINARKQTATFWMGIARSGPWVAQVGFTPAGHADVSRAAFRAVVVRAQQRLHELAQPE